MDTKSKAEYLREAKRHKRKVCDRLIENATELNVYARGKDQTIPSYEADAIRDLMLVDIAQLVVHLSLRE